MQFRKYPVRNAVYYDPALSFCLRVSARRASLAPSAPDQTGFSRVSSTFSFHVGILKASVEFVLYLTICAPPCQEKVFVQRTNFFA